VEKNHTLRNGSIKLILSEGGPIKKKRGKNSKKDRKKQSCQMASSLSGEKTKGLVDKGEKPEGKGESAVRHQKKAPQQKDL